MHRLQQHILGRLIRHETQRYADLKPAEVEGNLFMYHLRQLTKAGWVAKRPDGLYELTTEGQRYADTLSLTTFSPRVQPRIVTLVVCRNDAGQYLFYRRRRQPLLGMAGFPYGKIHLGETITAAAERELKEKTGLSAELTHRGDGYVTIYQHDEPVSQIMFHLFYGEHPSGRLLPDTTAGKPFWANLGEADDTFMPSVADLLKLLDETPPNERFFTELTYR